MIVEYLGGRLRNVLLLELLLLFLHVGNGYNVIGLWVWLRQNTLLLIVSINLGVLCH